MITPTARAIAFVLSRNSRNPFIGRLQVAAVGPVQGMVLRGHDSHEQRPDQAARA